MERAIDAVDGELYFDDDPILGRISVMMGQGKGAVLGFPEVGCVQLQQLR